MRGDNDGVVFFRDFQEEIITGGAGGFLGGVFEMSFAAEERKVVDARQFFDEEVVGVGIFAEVVVKVSNKELRFFVGVKKIVEEDNGIDAAGDGEEVSGHIFNIIT